MSLWRNRLRRFHPTALIGATDIPRDIASEFNVNVISTEGYVMGPSTDKGWDGNGSIVYTSNSNLDGSGHPVGFTVTTPSGRMSGDIFVITMTESGNVSFSSSPRRNIRK